MPVFLSTSTLFFITNWIYLKIESERKHIIEVGKKYFCNLAPFRFTVGSPHANRRVSDERETESTMAVCWENPLPAPACQIQTICKGMAY